MAVNSTLRLRVITAVSSIGLLAAGTALAQSPSHSPMAGSGGGLGAPSAAVPRPRPPALNPLKMEDVSKIEGSAVYENNGKMIGSVSTVLMKPESKTIDRFVVGEGGVLGIGSHRVALPIDAFSWDARKGGFTVAKSADDLKSMPEWKELSEAPGGTAARAVNGPAPGSLVFVR